LFTRDKPFGGVKRKKGNARLATINSLSQRGEIKNNQITSFSLSLNARQRLPISRPTSANSMFGFYKKINKNKTIFVVKCDIDALK
jgi:hypothetical protein